ncbi:MAG: hypothetical protein LBB72_08375 [Spirochaetaceae bacterium]|jgi:hypothetical protein|nr:hypothetical protein [Spirochaetaceae bacterium]
MTVTQTVEIPASHRLTIDVPREVPAGAVILTFTPKTADDGLDYEGECPICAAHRDPITGEERFNAETIATIEEGRAMMRGEIPAKWYNSLDEMWEDLVKEDADD